MCGVRLNSVTEGVETIGIKSIIKNNMTHYNNESNLAQWKRGDTFVFTTSLYQ